MTEPAACARTAASVTSTGAGRPGISGRGDDRVGLADVASDELLLALVLVLGERDRVSARALGAFDVELEERRAEALDLLLHDRADVESRDDRAEPAGGRDRLEPGDAGAEDEHLRRRDRCRPRS